MSLYRESVRRLSRIGVTLLCIFLIVSVVLAVQNCTMGRDEMLEAPFSIMPLLMGYVYVGGVALAYTGFSFLMKRADSDFYHSLPVKRADLFLSVTMAAMTWIVATVFLTSFSVTLTYIIMGRSFVPMYPLMNFFYYITATMLVFAAASIAVNLTGTWFSAVVVTGLVLFLPRFVLFIIGRGIAANAAGLVNWTDFNLLLNPVNNTAVLPAVLYFRPVLSGQMMNFSASAYSFALAVIEIVAARVLFVRRKSELAEHGAGNRMLQTAYACASALPLLLLAFSGRLSRRGGTETFSFNTSVVIVLVLSVACYVIYQMALLRSWKKTARSLPYYLVSAAAALLIMLFTNGVSKNVTAFAPAADEIAGVTFLAPSDGASGVASYRTLLVSDVTFTDGETISYVAENFAETRKQAQSNPRGLEDYYYSYNYYGYVNPTEDQQMVLESVRFTMKNGAEQVRNVLFPSRASLEEVRLKNDAYVEALSTFASADMLRYWSANGGFLIGDTERLRQSYVSEFPLWSIDSEKNGFDIIVYPDHFSVSDSTGLNQPLGWIYVGGYVGTQRFMETYPITKCMPETASLYMRISNERSNADYDEMMKLLTACLDQDASDWNYFNLNMTAYNAPGEGNLDGMPASVYLNAWGKEHDPKDAMFDVVMELTGYLARGTETDDPNAISVSAQYWAQMKESQEMESISPKFLAFSDEDTLEIVRLINIWRQNFYPELIGEPAA